MTSETIHIREACEGDTETMFSIMKEAAPAMHQDLHPSITPTVLKKSGWGNKQLFRVFLAEITESGVKDVIGFALSHHLYSTWEGFSSCLRHLYVKPPHRRRGIAKRLWHAVVKAALDEGCIRCDTFIPESNADGLQYFLKSGVMEDLTASGDRWHLFTIEGDTFSTFPQSLKKAPGSVTIRPAREEDLTGVQQLIQDLADYEQMPDGPKLDAKTLQYHTLDKIPPWCTCWVAEDTTADNTAKGLLVAYVIFFHHLSLEGQTVYMEDLYVMPSHRGKGIGQALWSAPIEIGLGEGARRCEFEVLEENTPSIAFYKSKGATDLTADKGYHVLRMIHSQMLKFVSSL